MLYPACNLSWKCCKTCKNKTKSGQRRSNVHSSMLQKQESEGKNPTKKQKEAAGAGLVRCGASVLTVARVLPSVFSAYLRAARNKREKVAAALTGVQPSLSGELSGDGGSTTMSATFTESSLHCSLR